MANNKWYPQQNYKKKTFPSSFKDGENIITDKIIITNKFNIFFTNICP